MTNKLVIVLLIAYFMIVCHPCQALTQELFGYDDYDKNDDFNYPLENYDHGQVTQNSKSYKAYLLHPPQCGLSNGDFSRVIGNPDATDAWPWMAPIFLSLTGLPSDEKYACGGTIISQRYILTVAHCFEFLFAHYSVHLGINNIKEAGVRIMVKNIITHPNYNDYTNENDIAIARLYEKISFTDRIRPICLPVGPGIKNKNLTGTYPFIAGWGKTTYNGNASEILLEAQIPVVSNPVCKDIYDSISELNLGYVIDDRVLCAGYRNGGIDACQGDSGGPFMLSLNKFYYLVGIISIGYRCGEPGFPGIYTRVTSFLDFILSNMN